MNILLVDDEELQLIRLKESIANVTKDATLYAFSNPTKVIEEVKDKNIDIAFLDIEMPMINGVMLAKSLKEINPKINIIFVTAYDNYALDAMKMHASGYVSKPVNEDKIKKEIEGLRYPIENKTTDKLQIKCFGNFDIFFKGSLVKFTYQKSKELFAYLVDREGSSANVNELNAILWEEDHKSYLRNLISDIQHTFKELGINDVFIKKHNAYCINPNNVECDAYEYKKNNPSAIRLYRGEYMSQYSWPIFKSY